MRVLCIEGMGDFPCIEDQLVRPFLRKYPAAFDASFVAWDNPVLYTIDSDIAIGHSLGGSVVQDYARHRRPKKIITLDPRRTDNLSWFDVAFPWRSAFPVVSGVEVHNFIHSPNLFFPGYEVFGAEENTRVLATHMNLPGTAAVFKCLEKMVL